MPEGTEVAKSASSSTMVADLPPSSRKTRLRVAAPFSMIRLPTAVEPVNEIRSTLGDSVSSSPTRWSDDVTTLRTPGRELGLLGDEPPEPGGVPRRVRRRLEHHRVAGGQRLAELVQRDLEREVPRDDGSDDADGLLPDLPRVGGAPPVHDAGQVAAPRELVHELDGVAQRAVERDVELVGVRRQARAADLEDQLLPQLLSLLLERVLQLGQALLATVPVASTSRSRRRHAAPRRWPGASRRSTRRPPGRAPLRSPG